MKQLYLLFVIFFITSITFSQEMLLNGNFENWDNSTFPTSWTHVENTSQESTEIHGGSFSAKHIGGTKDLGQTITGITPGESYTLTIWYKVGVEGDGTDARIWCYWKNGTTSVTDANTDDALRGPSNSYLNNNGGVWTEYTTTVTAPAGVDGFYFEVRTYSGATVYWDDFSFFNNNTMSVTKNQITGFSMYPNPVSNGKFVITSNNSVNKQVEIYSMIGKQVYSKTVKVNETIDVSNLNRGIYLLRVKEDDKVATRKLIID